jgi:hypothetical protein
MCVKVVCDFWDYFGDFIECIRTGNPSIDTIDISGHGSATMPSRRLS